RVAGAPKDAGSTLEAAGPSALEIPVHGVPGRTGLGRVPVEVPDLRTEEIHLLAVVERDLDGLLEVDPLEGRHRCLDDREVDRALDRVEGLVDLGVRDLGVVDALRLELTAVIVEVVAQRI